MKQVFHKTELMINAPKINKIHKIKNIYMIEKVHVYMWLHIGSFNSTAQNNARLFPSSFHIFTSSRLSLAEAFRKEHVIACSSALRSATEGNESGGNITIPCPSKLSLRGSTADWLKF